MTTRYNDFRINDTTIMQKTMLLWDNAHYTQNDNYALLVGALKKEGGDSRTVAFVGKVENPWSETKTKHVPELLVLKNRVIIFFLEYACFVNEC